jgi:hypothetical protein
LIQLVYETGKSFDKGPLFVRFRQVEAYGYRGEFDFAGRLSQGDLAGKKQDKSGKNARRHMDKFLNDPNEKKGRLLYGICQIGNEMWVLASNFT